MTFTEIRYEHIVLNKNGIPIIAGTTMKVVELVTAHIAYGWSAEELHFQFPVLILGQIHPALAYYWDHQRDLDDDIARSLAVVEEHQRTAPPLPLRERLRAQGRI